MPRYLGFNYFKEASESHHKDISEYFLSEPWHLEQEKNVVYIHAKTSNQLFAGLQPWKRVVPDVNFLAKEALHVEQLDELLGGFDPFDCQVYTKLSGIIPSSLQEENVDNSTNSQMSQTNLMRSFVINGSTEIQVHNLNQLKADLEKGHENFLDEPVLHDYLSELQSIQLRKDIKFEKIDSSNNIGLSEELTDNGLFLFKTCFCVEKPSKNEKENSDSVEAPKQIFNKKYQHQKYSSTELTGDKFDHALQEMSNAHLKNLQKIDAWEKQECKNRKTLFNRESPKIERYSTTPIVKTENNDKQCIEHEQTGSSPPVKTARQLQDTNFGSMSGSHSRPDKEIQSSNIDKKNSYLQWAITEISEKCNQQKTNSCQTAGKSRSVEHQKSLNSQAEVPSKTEVNEENDMRPLVQTNLNDQNKSPHVVTDSFNDGLHSLISTTLKMNSCQLTQSYLPGTAFALASDDTSDSLNSVLQNLAYEGSNNSTDSQVSASLDKEKAEPFWAKQTDSEQSFGPHDSGKNTVPADTKTTCLENMSCCHSDDNYQDPPSKKLRRSNGNVEPNNVNINGYSAVQLTTFNPLDSFLFLRTGLTLAPKKEEKQENEETKPKMKITVAPKNKSVHSSDVKITGETHSMVDS